MDLNLIEVDASKVAEIATDDLRHYLTKAIEISAKQLHFLAMIWNELERRGEDLSDLKVGLSEFLPFIASGRLEAEVVVRLAGRKTLIKALLNYPISEQQRLLRDGCVSVATLDEVGSFVDKKVMLEDLSAKMVTQVFGDLRVRSTQEQILLPSFRKKPKPKKNSSLSFKNGRLYLSRKQISAVAIIDALASNPKLSELQLNTLSDIKKLFDE